MRRQRPGVSSTCDACLTCAVCVVACASTGGAWGQKSPPGRTQASRITTAEHPLLQNPQTRPFFELVKTSSLLSAMRHSTSYSRRHTQVHKMVVQMPARLLCCNNKLEQRDAEYKPRMCSRGSMSPSISTLKKPQGGSIPTLVQTESYPCKQAGPRHH